MLDLKDVVSLLHGFGVIGKHCLSHSQHYLHTTLYGKETGVGRTAKSPFTVEFYCHTDCLSFMLKELYVNIKLFFGLMQIAISLQ